VVELRPTDIVPDHLVADRNGVACMDQQSDGACVALDTATRLCTIYVQRPQTCRDFQRGEALCHRTVGLARQRTNRG